MPQLPTTTVVTPCLIFGSICGAASTIWSSCVCTSMKPGATIFPATSMHRRRRCVAKFAPTAAMRSPSMRTSATKRGAPVPSTTVPPLQDERAIVVVRS